MARSFERSGLGDYNDDPETITRRARSFMRDKFLAAGVTITGANFVSAESGRVVVVTNEGNARFGQAGADVHIVLAGIEKLVPTDRDLAVFLNLLGRFRFFHQDPLAGFKAGALNFALRQTDPEAEIVAVIDSDYLVEPGWLRELVPLERYLEVIDSVKKHKPIYYVWGGEPFLYHPILVQGVRHAAARGFEKSLAGRLSS